jgi:CheY-like chemotaxis protein
LSNTILVIEDNPLNLEMVTDLLEASRFLVRSARTAEEGLRLARATSPDLVLMDISLPSMDGLAATRALRADPLTCHFTIVALTAHAMKGDEALALGAGCDGYLVKPINTRTFVASVVQFISMSTARRAARRADHPAALEQL